MNSMRDQRAHKVFTKTSATISLMVFCFSSVICCCFNDIVYAKLSSLSVPCCEQDSAHEMDPVKNDHADDCDHLKNPFYLPAEIFATTQIASYLTWDTPFGPRIFPEPVHITFAGSDRSPPKKSKPVPLFIKHSALLI